MREYGPDRVIGDVRFELSRESNSIHRYRVSRFMRERNPHRTQQPLKEN